MPDWVLSQIIKSALSNLAGKDGGRTTVIGFVAAALLAQHLNFALLLHGDAAQGQIAINAAICALFGYYTNHKMTG